MGVEVPVWQWAVGALLAGGVAVLGALLRYAFGSFAKRLEALEVSLVGLTSAVRVLEALQAERRSISGSYPAVTPPGGGVR